MILFTDTTDHTFDPVRLFGTIIIIVLSFILLLLVSHYLSRFVTNPAEEALKREKQFISDASHELKTPIAAISINAQALKGLEEDQKYLQNIRSEAGRMDQLIHRLLTLSYYEETGRTMEKDFFSLSESCEAIALAMESVAFEKKIEFGYHIEDDINCYGNSEEMKQVVAILLDNAMKHTPEKGIIQLTLSSFEKYSRLTVFNTGEGITPEDLPHIFERFYCAEKSRSMGGDSFGLGLAIAKAVVESNGGSIQVESKYGEDVCFIVEI